MKTVCQTVKTGLAAFATEFRESESEEEEEEEHNVPRQPSIVE